MNWRAILIVCLLMTSAMVMAPAARAAPFSGTVVLSDWNYHEQDYFDTGDYVRFEVTAYDAGAPLQSALIDVTIYGLAGIGVVFTGSGTTNSFGIISEIDYGPYAIGDYILYANYTGQLVVSKTFKVYTPEAWSATGHTSYFGDATDAFDEDQRVEVNVVILDQYGNPYDGSNAYYYIEHHGSTVDTEYLNTNSTGGDYGYYYPSGINQFGLYAVIIYNGASSVIGYLNFTVALPNHAFIQPQHWSENRTVFFGGESVGYEIHLFDNTTYPYDSGSYAARVLLFKQGEADPLVNWTLNTDSDGIDDENNLYTIGYDEADKGTYRIRVYNHTWQIIGTAIFMVIDLDISLRPSKSIYAQGDDVVIVVETSLQDAYRVVIANNAHTALTGASWNVLAGTSEWLHEFTFPEIADGTYYVDVYMDTLLIGSMAFELKKFAVDARLSQDNFLPGQSGTLFWRAVNNHDGGPISIIADTEMDYYDNTYSYTSDTLDDLSGTSGSFGITVPKDAYPGSSGDIDIDAEDAVHHTDYTSVGFNVGLLDISTASDRASYRPGESVYLTFNSFVQGSSSIVPSVEVRAQAQHDGVTVGNIWTVMTDGSGTAQYIYGIPASAAEGLYVIIINATFDLNRNIKHNTTSTFSVSNDPIITLMLYQEMSLYRPGSTVTVPYRVLRDGVETSGAQVSYEARLGGSWSSGNTIALGFGTGGHLTINLPADRHGSLFIQATAITSDGYTAFASLYNIEVSSGQAVLFTTKSVYLPGENITWVYVLTGDTEASAHYRITDPNGALLAEGVPANGTFIYRVPDTYPSTPTATVYITGAEGNYIESDTAAIYAGYMIEFTILRNSYSPGDIMKVNYTIVKIGQGPEETDGFQVQITFVGEYTDTIWVTELFGVLEFQLPEELRDGRHLVMIQIVGQPDTFDDGQTIIIDSDAGELAHGTIAGLNAGAFIVLILAIIALIIAIVGAVKWRKFAKASKTPQEASVPPPPPEAVPQQPGEYPPPPPPPTPQ